MHSAPGAFCLSCAYEPLFTRLGSKCPTICLVYVSLCGHTGLLMLVTWWGRGMAEAASGSERNNS